MNSSYVILEALENAAVVAMNRGELDKSVFDNVPQSHVFTPEPGQRWDEDDVESIKLVGDRDVLSKIHYWKKILDGLP